MKITLHGAAGEVTGSAYLIETDRARVLVDFGLFQGGGNTQAKNVLPAGLDPLRLDAVLVTHAHLDHTGRLPLLTKAGYAKSIYATKATVALAGLILRDSAKVQSYDVERTNRKRAGTDKPLVEALYNAEDVEKTMERFRVVELDQPFDVAEGVKARYIAAGHMLGSASIEVTVQEEGKSKIAVFSGDIGPSGMAILRDAETFKRANVVFLESTYGDRDHKPLKETLAEFRVIIEKTIQQKSRILVPAFAVGRTQQIIYHLDELFCAGTVKPFPVFIDSPMAIEATKIYQEHPDLFDDELLDLHHACEIASRHNYVQANSNGPGIDGVERYGRPDPDHGGLGHVQWRAHPAPSATRLAPSGNERDDCRVPGRGHARTTVGGRREGSQNFRRNDPGKRENRILEWIQRARRTDRVVAVVPFSGHVQTAGGPDPRRGPWTRTARGADHQALWFEAGFPFAGRRDQGLRGLTQTPGWIAVKIKPISFLLTNEHESVTH